MHAMRFSVGLLLWRDRNHNGISEPDELTPVAQAGIQWIGTDYQHQEAHRQIRQ